MWFALPLISVSASALSESGHHQACLTSLPWFLHQPKLWHSGSLLLHLHRKSRMEQWFPDTGPMPWYPLHMGWCLERLPSSWWPPQSRWCQVPIGEWQREVQVFSYPGLWVPRGITSTSHLASRGGALPLCCPQLRRKASDKLPLTALIAFNLCVLFWVVPGMIELTLGVEVFLWERS